MMIRRYRVKPIEVEAIQFQLGTTSKTEALKFCPLAYIGAPGGHPLDIRWFLIPHPDGGAAEVTDGDWIAKDSAGDFEVYTPEGFAQTYDLVED